MVKNKEKKKEEIKKLELQIKYLGIEISWYSEEALQGWHSTLMYKPGGLFGWFGSYEVGVPTTARHKWELKRDTLQFKKHLLEVQLAKLLSNLK